MDVALVTGSAGLVGSAAVRLFAENGFQVAGIDLNPVAWFIVKNELACTDPKEVKAFFDQLRGS